MPSTTTSKFFVVYVLESLGCTQRYVGYTKDLKARLGMHQQGRVFSTNRYKPWKLIYAEMCTDKEDALRRERYLKTTGGRRFLAKRLKVYYSKL